MHTADEMEKEADELDAVADSLRKWIKQSQGRTKIEGAIALARSRPEIAVKPEELDRKPMLLNVPNGTIELDTGTLREHRREDMLTRLCPAEYDPEASAPTFEKFLLEIMEGKEHLVAYLRRVFGYALTGEVSEDALWIFHGGGANGKTTLLEAVAFTVGPEYTATLAPDLLLVKRDSAHPTGLADLHGKRLTFTSELGDERRLAEGLVKQLTGRDTIKARRMREDFWEFLPTHKIVLATNHKPEIRGTDHAIWRRIRLVPFEVTFADEEQDKDLPAKLRAEGPGILAWLVRGAVEWHQSRLQDPPEVLAATEDYRQESDTIGDFLAECCLTGDTLYKAMGGVLYDAYKDWIKREGRGDPISGTAFGLRMAERFKKVRQATGVWYVGLGLKDDRKEEA